MLILAYVRARVGRESIKMGDHGVSACSLGSIGVACCGLPTSRTYQQAGQGVQGQSVPSRVLIPMPQGGINHGQLISRSPCDLALSLLIQPAQAFPLLAEGRRCRDKLSIGSE